MKGSSGTPATVTLDRLGIPFTVHAYAHTSGTKNFGAEAARELDLPPERVFKTLLIDTGAGLAVAIVPVAGELDLKAAATALGVKKVALAPPAVAERTTGMVVGGISPIGQKRALPTLLDRSALAFATVFVSGGRRGLDLELAPADLVQVTEAMVAVIARR